MGLADRDYMKRGYSSSRAYNYRPPRGRPKSRLTQKYYDFKRWFFKKRHPYSRLRLGDLALNLGLVIGSIFALLILLSYFEVLNGLGFGFIGLGTVIALVLLYFIAKYFYKALINLKYGIRGLTNGAKLILIFLFVVAVSYAYVNDDFRIDIDPQIAKDESYIIDPLEKFINESKEEIIVGYKEYNEKEKENKKKDIGLMEKEVVEKVNVIRIEQGIKPLVWDEQLYVYAKSHSEEMANRRELFHSSVHENYAENCWGGLGSTSWNAEDIVDGWMESSRHRTWLLCPNLQHVAVGICVTDNGMYASWTFWKDETLYSDWWYVYGDTPPQWWYLG